MTQQEKKENNQSARAKAEENGSEAAAHSKRPVRRSTSRRNPERQAKSAQASTVSAKEQPAKQTISKEGRTASPRRSSRGRQVRKTPVKIISLGGLGEIGKNIYVYECSNDIIIVDCGLAFPDDEMLGVDLVIPDFTYLERNREKVRGIFLTH